MRSSARGFLLILKPWSRKLNEARRTVWVMLPTEI